MTEPGQFQTAPPTNSFRFSLRALFLFVLFAGVMCSHIATSLRLKQVESELATSSEGLVDAEEELDELRSESKDFRARFGEYRSNDPNQLCVVASPFLRVKDLRWRWQVVAPDSNYRLCVAVNDIPEDGVPAHGGKVLVPQLPKDECSIEATVRRDHSGEWQLHAECVCVDSRSPAFVSVESDIAVPKSLGDSLAHSEHPPISLTTSSLTRVDGPVELLRPAPSRRDRQNEGSPAQKLGEGIILWIENDRPAPDSDLPPAPP